MISTLFTRGRRLYTGASLLTFAVAAFHVYSSTRPIPPEIDTVVQAMQNTSGDMGFGMSPSLWDIHQSLAFTMGITLATLSLLGMVLAGTTESTARVLSRTAAAMTAGCIMLTALYYVFRVPPPLISFAILTLAWGIAQRTTRLA